MEEKLGILSFLSKTLNSLPEKKEKKHSDDKKKEKKRLHRLAVQEFAENDYQMAPFVD